MLCIGIALEFTGARYWWDADAAACEMLVTGGGE